MIYLSALFAVYIVGSLFVIFVLIEQGRQERAELEDRLMALSKPDAILTHKGLRDEEPARVTYVDEELRDATAPGIELED